MPGIPGDVDLNWFIGSYEELISQFMKDESIKSISSPTSPEHQADLATPEPIAGNTDAKDEHVIPADFLNGDEPDDEWIKRYFFGK